MCNDSKVRQTTMAKESPFSFLRCRVAPPQPSQKAPAPAPTNPQTLASVSTHRVAVDMTNHSSRAVRFSGVQQEGDDEEAKAVTPRAASLVPQDHAGNKEEDAEEQDRLLPTTTISPNKTVLSGGSWSSSSNTPRPSSPPPPPTSSLTPKVFPSSKSPSSVSLHSKVMRENLMREQHGRDPLFYYDVVSVLGVGSMGSVAKVRKKDSVVGGSARKVWQKHFQREQRREQCFSIPFVGGMFRYCVEHNPWGGSDASIVASTDNDNDEDASGSRHASSSVGGRSRSSSSILFTKNAVVGPCDDEPYGGGSDVNHSTSSGYEQMYAMKSIHLSRVTDPAFVEELRNEIQMLRTLDHPRTLTDTDGDRVKALPSSTTLQETLGSLSTFFFLTLALSPYVSVSFARYGVYTNQIQTLYDPLKHLISNINCSL